ncbi:nucleolar protein 6 [Caerostris extrusa]|uniref:Nucleolar protein 6 n=1 Tax=Caerostris extrusa TaxID=172846 RepID=A0AAV4P7A5_CAEEX|nr:nucleolar protein 6 [Caerostris extrusa]
MDFLNQRYHRKRALYLSFIANSLLESDVIHNVKFKYQNECYLKPVLLVQPKDLEITVCLAAYPASNAFKLSRFLPSKNNVRSSWYFENTEDAEQSSMEPVATPYYNASILSDLLLPQLNKYLKSNINSQNVKEGLILLKLWCFQRGLTDGYGRLNGFILTMFVAYLLKKRKITPLMSSYQVFRSALLGFSKTVQHEAKLGIQILDKESPESFDHLFMNKIIINRKFEYLLHLKGPKKFNKYLQNYLLRMSYKRK